MGLAMKSLLFATVALAALTTGAMAADAVTKVLPAPTPAPAAPIYNWTGAYIGGQIGYEWARTSYTFSNAVPNGSFTPSGFVGGVHVGYNYQFDTPLVVGVEGDIEYANVKGGFNNPFGGMSAGSADLRWQGSARVRIGYALDRFLPYVTGGVAFGNFRFEGGPDPASLMSWTKTRVGWTIGGGLEYAFSRNWSARIEYRYTDFGTAASDLAPAYSFVTETMKVRDHAVRIGVSYKF